MPPVVHFTRGSWAGNIYLVEIFAGFAYNNESRCATAAKLWQLWPYRAIWIYEMPMASSKEFDRELINVLWMPPGHLVFCRLTQYRPAVVEITCLRIMHPSPVCCASTHKIHHHGVSLKTSINKTPCQEVDNCIAVPITYIQIHIHVSSTTWFIILTRA